MRDLPGTAFLSRHLQKMKIHAPLTACIVPQQLLVLVGLDTRPAPHWVLLKAPHLVM
jgi:hypothetical protein